MSAPVAEAGADQPAPGQMASGQPVSGEPASGSSFYMAMRILPAAQRDAMYAVYRFCRAVDDIADEEGPAAPREAALAEWRQAIDRLFEDGTPPPQLPALAEWTRRFGLRREDFQAVIDGMEMDLQGPIRAPNAADLDLYCDRVASAVGRLSCRIFGVAEDKAGPLAHHLGRALQLTNILRDVDEDAGIGRLYLPREALTRAGIAETDPARVLAHPGLAQVCTGLAAEARQHFEAADRIMAGCPRRTIRAPKLMQVVYRSILDKTAARGWDAPRERVRPSKLLLIGALLRYGIR